MARERFDIRQHITDRIIAQFEAGAPPWRQPWTGTRAVAGFPLRHTGEGYKGINILILWATADAKGYASDRWMTFNQARQLGGAFRKGERAAKSVFYESIEPVGDAPEQDTADAGNARRVHFAKVYNVFNADQIEGLPDEYYIRPDPPRDLGTQAEPKLDAWFAATGARIDTSDEPRAYYRPCEDRIHMPPIGTFHDAAGYYGTLAHEIIHWTGAGHRLDRITRFEDRRAYAFEELVAEIGACFLGLHLGIAPRFGQSAAYIEGWIAAMKADRDVIFRAAAEAQKAVDYLDPLRSSGTPATEAVGSAA
ncbi:DNA primase TraC [Jannaschia aquimarina]|uniref:TraC_1 protein n=2 Tax=Jannaschia aquimarina TaxID=935700 RepID=A0A0D1EI66_9RHOB|nr:zincin-like metallopeptidase domain-containing protein [Jannaschia aquimarina]KIT16596.1 DNA primase TraC [Jannaschia aquimarina]SNT41994.1 Antirestriction protein ArdC [Jannaschia aquimarina]